MRKHVLLFGVVLAVLSLHLSRANEVAYPQALSIVKNLEKSVDAIKFTTSSSVNKNTHTSFTYDASQKRYLLEGSYTNEWTQGTNPHISCKYAISFDGKQYREYSQCVPGIRQPQSNERCDGIISIDLSDSPLNKNTRFDDYGLTIGSPLLFFDYYAALHDKSLCDTTVFSKFLERWHSNGALKSIRELNQNEWEIAASFVLPDGVQVRLVATYNLSKGGVVTNVKYYCRDPDNSSLGEVLENEYLVEFQEKNFPKRITKKHWRKGESLLVEYDTFATHSGSSISDYSLSFPDGTFVDDFIKSIRYRVGDPINVDKAIDEFMQRHGLTGDFPKKTFRNNAIRFTLIGAGLILIGIAVYQMLQQKRRRS